MTPSRSFLAAALLAFASTFLTSSSTNITALLQEYKNLSNFAAAISGDPALVKDINSRSSITVLAVPNDHLNLTQDVKHSLDMSFRSHVLLQYLSKDELSDIPQSGISVPTLPQTTAQAQFSFSGMVNISNNRNNVTVHFTSSPSIETNVLGVINAIPNNISILLVDSLLRPQGLDLMASQTGPPLGLNITKALIGAQNFIIASSMLSASGVATELERNENGAGITLFIPTDTAFCNLSPDVEFKSLPADKKSVALKFHVLHSYYPLGSLESIVNPVQPTLATEEMGAGTHTLNISRINGSLSINTGLVQASVTQTVVEQNPVSIFGVSRVLLPKEIFGNYTR